MHYVYILDSLAVPGHFYIGSTDNLRQRLRQHQADVDAHTAKYRPWKLKTYLAFEKKATAVRFESYLKSGSSRAFCKRTSTSGSSPFFKGLHCQPLSATPIKREQRKGRNGWQRGHVSGRVMTIHLFFRLPKSKIGFALLNAKCVHNCYRK
jgi:putative endonuclease